MATKNKGQITVGKIRIPPEYVKPFLLKKIQKEKLLFFLSFLIVFIFLGVKINIFPPIDFIAQVQSFGQEQLANLGILFNKIIP